MEPQTRSQGEGLLIGYARVSTADQSLDLQLDELRRAGCEPERIYTDVASGARDDRPGLKLTLEVLRRGDTLVVWKLDRLGRSLRHLIETVAGEIASRCLSHGRVERVTVTVHKPQAPLTQSFSDVSVTISRSRHV